jgi:hypothetical protein
MPNGSLRGMLLKDRITEILRGDGKSISEIYKEINMDEESKVHRLSLTGYLWAMADFNILKEKYLKPSKIYYLVKKDETSIYQYLKDKMQNEPEDKRGEETLYLLYVLLERPVFDVEIEKAGVTGKIKGKRIDRKERKNLLSRVEIRGIKIGPDSEAYIPVTSYPNLAVKVFGDMVAEKYDVKRDKNGIQKKLENIL